jgi:hypothetical protein
VPAEAPPKASTPTPSNAISGRLTACSMRRVAGPVFDHTGNDQVVVGTAGGFDAERHIDLLHVDWPARDEMDIARTWSETVPAQLDLTPKAAGGQETPHPGAYEISVEVRARNADAIRYAIPP